MYLETIDFVVLAAYLLGLFGLGIYFSRKHVSRDGYFLGDRKVSPLLAGISVLATLLSTISYLSVPGEMIRHGIGFFGAYLALIPFLPIATRIIIPALKRLPVTSIYEYLEKRYCTSIRTLASATFILTRLLWSGLVLYTASFAISAMTGWSVPSIVLVMGVVTTFYTTTGGLKAVVWSDFAQFVILFGGALLIPIFICFQTHSLPVTWWETFSQAGRTEVPLFSFDPTVRITLIGTILLQFVWSICTHGADQVAAQRYLSTDSLHSARRSVWIYTLCLAALMFVLLLCALAVFYSSYVDSRLTIQEFQTQIAPEADKVLPRYIASHLPAGLSGLLLSALLAAAMSSLSSAINSISTVADTDFFHRFNLLGARSSESLRRAMVLAGLIGGAGIFFALLVNSFMERGTWNLLELMERANHLFVAPLGALFFAGIFFRKVGTAAALGGFVAGSLAGILIAFSGEVFGPDSAISFMWIMPVALLISLVVSYLFGVFLKPPAQEKLASLLR